MFAATIPQSIIAGHNGGVLRADVGVVWSSAGQRRPSVRQLGSLEQNNRDRKSGWYSFRSDAASDCNGISRARQLYISRVAMHAAGFLGTYAGQVKIGGDVKCKCVCNYARGFRSNEQNSSKGIYVMHRRRPVKPPCLHAPKQHRKGDILATGASTCACIAKLNAQTSSSSGYNEKQKTTKTKNQVEPHPSP